MSTKFSILILFLLYVLDGCRYKDNDYPSLLSTQRRLSRAWVLTEAHLIDSNNLDLIKRNPSLVFDTIYFKRYDNRKKTQFRYSKMPNWFPCELRIRKTKIYLDVENLPLPISDYHLNITKLTTKELWMNGHPLLGMHGRESNKGLVNLKYKAAD